MNYQIIEIDKSSQYWGPLIALAESINIKNRIWLLDQPAHMISDHILAVISDSNEVVGFHRMIILPMGKHKNKPLIVFKKEFLVEAEGKAQGTAKPFRNQGIARMLQEEVMKRARELGCYQLRSEIPYEVEPLFHIKISMGFGIQLNYRGNSAYFVKALNGDN